MEKLILLENISLLNFLGEGNRNMVLLGDGFPKSKIISRGEEIKLKGSSQDLFKISRIFENLIKHYHYYGKITEEDIRSFLKDETSHYLNSLETPLVFATGGNMIKAKTINQKKLVDLVCANDLVFALGPAGTGKTYISMALAVKALKNKEVKKIIITRPAVESGENLGFLPGDLKEKLAPYLRPIYDALDDLIPKEKLKYYMEYGIIEIAPLAYMRGRTLHKAFTILDEAQNTTPVQIKMFLTRMGRDSKTIITGDTSQIDLPKKQRSGLVESINVLKNIKGIGIIEFEEVDIMRHTLVKKIIQAYKENT